MSLPTWAGIEIRHFDKPEQEALYDSLMFELRCLVCQNENLAASNADLAKDLRDEVYEMIIQKDWNEAQVKKYLVDRYGDFVLYKPPMKTSTFLLWFGPLFMLLIGFFILFIMVRNNSKQPTTQLDDKSRKAMRKLLNTEDKS
ncbi:MAG TPA: cytochrome c-type biogenesis protein CcmH [Thiothrix sp.]|nr:cytochrome c-type biogenesis protein CcmH [Thiothrix sp.]